MLDSKLAVEIKDGRIGYSSKEPLLSSINVDFSKGEIVAIAGPSGIGKTTLLRTIAGLVPPLGGSFLIGGKNKNTRGELGYIPQRLGLVRHASVYHNVLLGALAGHTSPWFPFSFNAKKLHYKPFLRLVWMIKSVLQFASYREGSREELRQHAL